MTVERKTASLMGFGEVKFNKEGVFIQGFANKSVVDRGNDIIAVDAWDLKNFENNPVILYNHGFDPQLGSTPVGKAVSVKPTEQGLWVKAQLSSMDDPLINRIRGLVQEKILRAFSVGFNSIEQERDEKSGVKTIKKAELFEISIVGVPMNQDSLFEVTGKMLKAMDMDALRHDILERKGAWVAAAIHNAIYGKQKDEGLEREAMLEAIAEKADIEMGALTDILAGNVTPVPEGVLMAVSEVLGLDAAELSKLDKGDAALEDGAAKEPSEEEKPEPEVEVEVETEGEPKAAEPAEAGAGGDGEATPSSDAEPAKDTSFQDCVSSGVIQGIKDGKDQNEAVAAAISACSEGKCATPTREQYASWFKLADSLVTKQAGQDVPPQPTTEITTDRTEAAQSDINNPHLDAARQTNILLGQLIAEVQLLTKTVTGLQVPPAAAAPAAAPAPAAPAAESAKAFDEIGLDYAWKRLENIKARLCALES